MDRIILAALGLGALGFLVATVAFAVRWRGVWRWAAFAPFFAAGFMVLRIIIDVRADPTSHNLWPLELLLWGGLACAFLLIVGLCRALYVRFYSSPQRQ